MIDEELNFVPSEALTVGTELEVMLIDADTGDMVHQAVPLMRGVERGPYMGQLKFEVTQSMLEINSRVHQSTEALNAELVAITHYLDRAARSVGARICGGGVHPFHSWPSQKISPSARFEEVSERYGYLAKQFAVFGQHIHVGVGSGDTALRVLHALARYVPQLIALTASSPLYRGIDTRFDCCRLNFVAAFPHSGHAPPIKDWAQFSSHIERIHKHGIIGSMKDLYWDIRPKPQYGTVEVRVLDTPLDVQLAADAVSYVQALVHDILQQHGGSDLDELYLPYRFNRFQACRFGLEGRIVDPQGKHVRLADDVRQSIDRLQMTARSLGSSAALDRLYRRAEIARNGSSWIREQLAESGDLRRVVLGCVERWIDRAQAQPVAAGESAVRSG